MDTTEEDLSDVREVSVTDARSSLADLRRKRWMRSTSRSAPGRALAIIDRLA